MSNEAKIKHEHRVLSHLSCLPKKILSLHGTENIPEFVLHELCDKECFNIEKAAYFVDNPDFDCLKGVAGFAREEEFPNRRHLWQDPENFSNHMKECTFNKKVRTFVRPSHRRAKQSDAQTVKEIAQSLGIKHPCHCSWKMKNDNQGLFVYEKEGTCELPEDFFENALSLLAFCPIY